jgi:iron complex transport system substrate-binding protein
MKLTPRAVLAACVAFAFAASPALSQNLTITHAQSTTEVPLNPAKVITYDLAALDTLDALGVKVTGVPGFNMPANLDAYEGDEYEKVGSLFEPDYEAVNALAPGLIIVAGRSAKAYGDLSKIAPTIDVTNDWSNFVDSVKTNSRILGEIFDKSAEVESMIADLDASIADFQASSGKIGTALVIMTSGGEVTAFGPGSRFGLVYDTLGVKPAVTGTQAATHGDAVSFEFLLETNPDWLIVLDRDAAIGQTSDSARQVLDNELMHQTAAWQNDHIIYVDSARWYVTNGGIANLNAMVGELGNAMLSGD